MKTPLLFLTLVCLCFLSSCIFVVGKKKDKGNISSVDSSNAFGPVKDTIIKDTVMIDTVRKDAPVDTVVRVLLSGKKIDTRNVQPQEVITFAKTLIGTPYHYASTDPKVGFDCSGFITYVFHHFDILVPRSSIDFTAVGNEVSAADARPGDLILFTGTDSTERFVGHMGLVVDNTNGVLNFIHSTSGKKHGVTITPFSDYYKSRYMKTIRIFP